MAHFPVAADGWAEDDGPVGHGLLVLRSIERRMVRVYARDRYDSTTLAALK